MGGTYTDDRGVAAEYSRRLNRRLLLGIRVDIPDRNSLITNTLKVNAILTSGIPSYPRRHPEYDPASMGSTLNRTFKFDQCRAHKPSCLNRRTHPSLRCPTSVILGLNSFSGSLGYFVRSKIYTSPDTAFVASRSGFCGMYRARLTSFRCVMRWMIDTRGCVESVCPPSSPRSSS